jgi:hypothetical protein
VFIVKVLSEWGYRLVRADDATEVSRTKRLVAPMTSMTMTMRMVQNAKAFPNLPASTSERICEVIILVFGVVMNTIGDRVVIERANAYVRPAMKAGLMRGIVTLVKV